MKREYPEAPIAAVGVVVLKEDKVLLIRRSQEPTKGRWSLPGGAVELGETVRQAAEREILEECSVEVKAGEVIEVLDAITPGVDGRFQFHYILSEILAEYVSGEARADSDALEVRWFGIEELDPLDMLNITKQVIKEGFAIRNRIHTGEITTEGRIWQREFWS